MNKDRCIKVGFQTEKKALESAIENNSYYAYSISKGRITPAIGSIWCDECQEWHMKYGDKKKRPSFLQRLFDI